MATEVIASGGPASATPYASSKFAARPGSGMLLTAWHEPLLARTGWPRPACRMLTLGAFAVESCTTQPTNAVPWVIANSKLPELVWPAVAV